MPQFGYGTLWSQNPSGVVSQDQISQQQSYTPAAPSFQESQLPKGTYDPMFSGEAGYDKGPQMFHTDVSSLDPKLQEYYKKRPELFRYYEYGRSRPRVREYGSWVNPHMDPFARTGDVGPGARPGLAATYDPTKGFGTNVSQLAYGFGLQSLPEGGAKIPTISDVQPEREEGAIPQITGYGENILDYSPEKMGEKAYKQYDTDSGKGQHQLQIFKEAYKSLFNKYRDTFIKQGTYEFGG